MKQSGKGRVPTRRDCLLHMLCLGAAAPAWAVDDAEEEPFVPGAAPGVIRRVTVLPLIMASQVGEPELKEYVALAGERPDTVVRKTDARGRALQDRKGVPLFQVSQAWVDRVMGPLRQGGLDMERYADRRVALAARRLFDFRYLTTAADAVLDLRVETAGYGHSMGVGWVPQLVVNASFSSMRSGEEIAAYTYWSDHRQKPKDPRCFPAPQALIYDGIAALQAHAEDARAAFEQTLGRITEKLVDDVLRCAAGQVPEA